MSGLDFVVHDVLYGYGLRFSFDWAAFYWWIFGGVFLVFGGVAAFAYWVGSARERRNCWVSVCLFLSVVLLFVGDLEDFLWFVLWGGGLPSADVVWWWSGWYWLFGFWNSFWQLVLFGGVCGMVVLSWALVLD